MMTSEKSCDVVHCALPTILTKIAVINSSGFLFAAEIYISCSVTTSLQGENQVRVLVGFREGGVDLGAGS